MEPRDALREGDAVLVIDVQPDFCPGGALPVDRGDEVIVVLNRWIDEARSRRLPVYASRDWHPAHHLSFREEGGPWPAHCIQDSTGASFHPDLHLPPDAIKISKGVRLDHEQYSAFDDTGLAADMKRRQVRRVWIGGLALDVCVKKSGIDGARRGFEMHLIPEGSRAIDPSGVKAVERELILAGVVVERGA